MTESEPLRKMIVAVSGDAQDGRNARLFDTLSRLYPVEFRRVGRDGYDNLDGLIVLDGDIQAGRAAAERGIASYVVVEGRKDAVLVPATEVRLAKSSLLDEKLSDQVMNEDSVTAFQPIAQLPEDVVLGTKGGLPFWLERPGGRGACQLVAIAPPVLREDEYLVEHFHGGRFLRLLPLMNFVRQLVKDVDWQAPAQHACLVLDDPSLYWPTYGYVNFRRISEHARQHNYFISVAIIPLDSWWVNRSVADVFRSPDSRLSLVIHGNNHTWSEMLNLRDGTGSLKAAAQALRRVDRLESRYGLSVSKVMEPPHGAIAESVLPHLLSVGFEGALVTSEFLVQYNRRRATWPVTIGLERASIVCGGMPVIPRIRAHPAWKNDVVLAAFLRQPIVVTVHHQDAAHGMDALADIARAVNGVGPVVWSDMRGILQGSYVQRLVGDVLHLRMLSRAVTIAIPSGVRQLCVERSWITQGHSERIVISSSAGTIFDGDAGTTTGQSAVGEADVIQVSSELPAQLHYSSVSQPGVPFWPIARKVMTEARDRLTPVLSRFGLGWQSTRTPPQ